MAVTTSQITITTMEGWYSGDTAPSNPLIGDLWLDTTTNEIKKWNGTNWIKQADTQGPQGPKGDSIKSRGAYWIKSITKPEKPTSETIGNWTPGSEPPETVLNNIGEKDNFWRVYKITYSNGENAYSEYSEVELIGSYEVLKGLVQFRNGVTTTENKEGQNITVIDGGKIKTGSIKADKMSIKDLSALKAKIGGFNIGENSIYSGTKSSINNKEKGIYFDSNGHLYFGDDKNYMRFFQSADDGKYKLKISTDSLVIGSGLDVEKAFEDIKGDIQNTQDSADNVKDQIVSMGEQLIINGNGLMGDNTNFSALIFDASKANGSPGSFTREGTSYMRAVSDSYIPINPNLRYSFEIDAISKNGLIRMYSFLDFYDVDKKSIDSDNHMYIENTLTYLTQDLKNGDTVVHFNDLSGWNDTFYQNYRRGFIFWNYTNSFGYTYPELTYSRNSWRNLYENSNVDKTNNTITLNAPWSHGTFEAGTKVSQCNSGATYKYQGMGYAKVPTEWTHYSGFYDGTDYSGKNVSTKFPPGTAYAKVGFLWNYDELDDQCWVTNISLKTDYDNAIKNAQTAANKAQGTADEALKGSKENATQMAQMLVDFNGDIKNLQDQIDGNITTWFYNVDPAMNLPPVTDWDTNEKKDVHLGDIYYNTAKGYAWRFMKSGSTYSWERITDTDVTKALADAAKAQDTADSKRRIFYNTPTVPYDAGDLWVQGSKGDILRCVQAKTSLGSYDRNDWILASKYTDDSALTTWIKGDFATTIQGLEKGLVDAKIETYYQATDPSTGWSDTQKSEHEGDLWYNSTASVQKYYRWSGTAWQELTATPPQAVFDTIDNKATIYTGTTPPSNPSQGDLWLKGTNDPILTYVGNTWVKYDKYTDDTKAEKAITNAATAQSTAVEAAKTADNYISADSTGIMVSKNTGAIKETPSNATKSNVLITDQDVQIRKGKKTVASYGSSVIIGNDEGNSINIGSSGIDMVAEGQPLAKFGLSNATKYAPVLYDVINKNLTDRKCTGLSTYKLNKNYANEDELKMHVTVKLIYHEYDDGVLDDNAIVPLDEYHPNSYTLGIAGDHIKITFDENVFQTEVKYFRPSYEGDFSDVDIALIYPAAYGLGMATIGNRLNWPEYNDTGDFSLAIGTGNVADDYSMAIGVLSFAQAYSIACGNLCTAGDNSCAFGYSNQAELGNSFALGSFLHTDAPNQLVIGYKNKTTAEGITARFVVAGGSQNEVNEEEPYNSAAITDDGDVRIKGDLYTHCNDDSSGGKSIIDLIYPVGSIYMSVNSADPSTLFGGSWERIQDTFLLASGNSYGAGSTGGSAKATLPSHTHTFGSGGYQMWGAKIGTGSTEPGNQISGDAKYYAAAKGKSTSNYKWLESVDSKGASDVSQANMPPYLAVYVWKRIS